MTQIDQTQMIGTTPGEMSGATMQMPAGNFDPLRTQMGGTIQCPVCKSASPLTEMYCGECGFLLSQQLGEQLDIPAESAPPAVLVDGSSGHRYRLREGVNTLGRQGADILVNEGTVSRLHARITIQDGSIIVEDLGSSNGTKVGAERIGPNQPTAAEIGTILKFGSWQATLASGSDTLPASPADKTIAIAGPDRTIIGAPAENLALPLQASEPEEDVVELGPLAGKLVKIDGPAATIPIPVGTVTIGRKSENIIALPQDSFISGRHAEITTDDTGIYITDLGSSNGTTVNGVKLEPHERQILRDDDEVQMGQTRYKLESAVPQEAQEKSEAHSGSSDNEVPGGFWSEGEA